MRLNIQHPDDIPAKKLAGETTTEENISFEAWSGEKNNKQLYQTLDKIKLDCDYEQALQMKNEILEKTFNKIFSLNKQPRSSSKKTLIFLSIASSLALLVSIVSIYFLFTQKEKNISLVTLSCPSGISTIVLPDSSIVTLNAGSTLSYPANFDNSLRQVNLTGEAFFDVKHNSKQPFIVITEHINIKVLGTKFNMSAYSDEEEVITSLVSGSIELKDKKHDQLIRILPNQLAIYNKKTEEIHLQTFDPEYVTGWISGELFFKKMPFNTMCNMLERKFSCVIENQNSNLHEKLFTGKFVNNESLPQILDIIKINTPFNYTIKNNVVRIY